MPKQLRVGGRARIAYGAFAKAMGWVGMTVQVMMLTEGLAECTIAHLPHPTGHKTTLFWPGELAAVPERCSRRERFDISPKL